MSLHQLARVDLGFDTHNVITRLDHRLPTDAVRTSRDASSRSGISCRRRVEALPGVARVAFATAVPPNIVDNFNNFDLEDFPDGSPGSRSR